MMNVLFYYREFGIFSGGKMMERLSERLLAENPREMIRLRLNRLRSVKLNEAILKEKNDKLDIPTG
ncbi:hypothetical protein [Paenibacillus sp. B-A-8]|uniref:hypothetical protein n=1 Tax=Paenibacillus sp. B-A-8 TaxID=3400419 RepID=UPI003B020D1D